MYLPRRWAYVRQSRPRTQVGREATEGTGTRRILTEQMRRSFRVSSQAYDKAEIAIDAP